MFRRGTSGLQGLLNRFWRREHQYYLGEWHFHPDASPVPSRVDNRQLAEIARDLQYRCPEPVLLIIGRSPPTRWDAAAFVFLRGRGRVPLREDNSTTRAEASGSFQLGGLIRFDGSVHARVGMREAGGKDPSALGGQLARRTRFPPLQ
jgi:hypothetical protein